LLWRFEPQRQKGTKKQKQKNERLLFLCLFVVQNDKTKALIPLCLPVADRIQKKEKI
jgi:hypothetical protein